MTLTQLEYFCAVCRHGSIAKAAEELYVSHPTVSVAIKSLESEFSLQLLARSGNRVTPTRDGMAFYRMALGLLQRRDQMYADFAKRPESSYRVHVGIPPIRSTVLFPRLLEEFRSTSDVPVVLHEYSTRRSLARLESGDLDCCLVNAEDEALGSYEHVALLRDRFVLAVSGESPLGGRSYVTARDLRDVPLILQNGDSALNEAVMQAFSKEGIRPDVLMYSSQVSTTRDFVSRGLAAAFLYKTMLPQDGAPGPFDAGEEGTVIPVAFRPAIRSTFALAWPRGGYVNRNVRAWIEFVRGAFAR
ncbi:MAG: LysR family transcriptional regulator [Atopobiaceae bacterium]